MISQTIPLKQIKADAAFNVRASIKGGKDDKSDTTIEALAADIKKNGQINPLIVRANEKGGYTLVAGFRRYAALEMLDKKEAFVQVFDGTEEDAYFLNLTENTARRDLTPFEIAARCVHIQIESVKWGKDGKELSGNAIASRVSGHSKSYVNNLMRAVRELHKELLQRWKDESTDNPKMSNPTVRYMTTDTINKLIREKDPELQLAMPVFSGLTWLDIKSGKTSVDDEPSEEGEGNGGAGTSEGPKRPSKKVLEEAIEAVRENESLSPDMTKGIVQALEFCLGQRAKLAGYTPKKAKKVKKDEEASAEA